NFRFFIAYRRNFHHFGARQIELLPHPGGVGIHDLADEYFIADGEQVYLHFTFAIVWLRFPLRAKRGKYFDNKFWQCLLRCTHVSAACKSNSDTWKRLSNR